MKKSYYKILIFWLTCSLIISLYFVFYTEIDFTVYDEYQIPIKRKLYDNEYSNIFYLISPIITILIVVFGLLNSSKKFK